MADASKPETLSEKLALLSSRDLRAAIEAAVVASPEVLTVLEDAVSSQLRQQHQRRVAREQKIQARARAEAGKASSVASEGSSTEPLTPLYSMLFDEDGTAAPPPAANNKVSAHSSNRTGHGSSCRTSEAQSQASYASDGSMASSCGSYAAMASSANGSAANAGSGAASAPLGVSSGAGGARKPFAPPGSVVRRSADAAPWTASPQRPVASSTSSSAADASSRRWTSGFIFFCRHDSFRETFERGVFGLAAHKGDHVAQIDERGTALFLFDMTYRYLHGVFEAASAPGHDLDPEYLRKSSSGGSPFPAQIRFRRLHDYAPLMEVKMCHLVTYNQGTNVFRHRLNEKATHELLHLLVQPESAPRDNRLPYETNGYRLIPPHPKFEKQRRAVYGDPAEMSYS
jgi:hypothetical protein